MSDFKAKMHQIDFPWGAYSTPPDPVAVFKGPTSKEREEEGKRNGNDKEGEGRGGEGRKGKG